ncbi:muscarinic acetylcholine receptor M2-like [Diadema antillarum]|uniref:muscarinic acetylcholine receptor M2-like n=1 Tax=Diadema antillarum TaxID=105358 RepID=UPI003A835935
MNNVSSKIDVHGGTVLKATLDISWQAGVLFSISLITVIVNSVILLAFYYEKKLRTYSNYYIINITIADLLVGLICMPIRGLMFAFDRTWILGQTFCYIFTGINQVLPGVSVFGTVIICFDRYLATVYPLLHYRKKSKKVAIVVNVLTWLIPLSLWMGLSTIWDLVSPNMRVSPSGFCPPNYAEHVASVLVIIVLRAGIPFGVILVLSVQIFYRAKSASRNRMVDHVSFATEVAKEGKTVFKDSHHISLSRVTEDKISTKVKTNEVKQNITSIYGQEIIARRQKEKVAPTDVDTCGTLEQDRHSDEKSGSVFSSPPDGAHTLSCTVPRDRCNALSFADVSHSYRVPVSFNVGERSSVTARKARPDPLLEGITTAKRHGEKRISDGSKALRTLAFLVVAFYLTWFLNTLNIILRSAAPAWITSLLFAVHIRESGRWLSYCNSTLNPLAYTLAQPLLRQTIRKMFCKDN